MDEDIKPRPTVPKTKAQLAERERDEIYKNSERQQKKRDNNRKRGEARDTKGQTDE